MITKCILACVAAIMLMTSSALAQTGNRETNGHHYNGGPKTEAPHHTGKKDTEGVSKNAASGGHHYNGGPNTSTPHHMGDR